MYKAQAEALTDPSGTKTGRQRLLLRERYWRVEDVEHRVDYVWNEVYVALPSSSSSIYAEWLLHRKTEK